MIRGDEGGEWPLSGEWELIGRAEILSRSTGIPRVRNSDGGLHSGELRICLLTDEQKNKRLPKLFGRTKGV